MRKKWLVIAVMLFVAVIACAGCGIDEIDVSQYEDAEVVLRGIEEEDIVLTVKDLQSFEVETITTESTSDKIGEVRATGVWLDTVLEAYDCKQADFSKLHFYGSDEYDVNLYSEYLKEHPIFLAFGINGEPLDEESIPVRIIIRNSDSAYWVRMVTEIGFEK